MLDQVEEFGVATGGGVWVAARAVPTLVGDGVHGRVVEGSVFEGQAHDVDEGQFLRGDLFLAAVDDDDPFQRLSAAEPVVAA